MKELVDYARIIYSNPLNEKTIIEVIYEDQFSYKNMEVSLGEYYQDVILEKKENGVIIFQGKKIQETIQKKKEESLNNKYYTFPLYNCEIIIRNSDSITLNS
jgi:hypothetical protein